MSVFVRKYLSINLNLWLTTAVFFGIILYVERHGGVAQLGERLNGIQEVNGSIPSVSTIP